MCLHGMAKQDPGGATPGKFHGGFKACLSTNGGTVEPSCLSRLTGPARLLAMSWSTLVLDSKDGVRVLLTRLAGSPLVRKSLPKCRSDLPAVLQFPKEHRRVYRELLGSGDAGA